MNKKAKELGMKHTHFTNPHGLPEKQAKDDNVSAPIDLVILAEELLKHPEIMELTSTYRDKFRNGKFDLQNSNHLLEQNKYGGVTGVDGLKTGYIRRAGFCITASCLRNKRRIIAVVTGFKDASSSKRSKRDTFVKQLLEWGYQQR
jgi:D-alanyl-D-alanine carboxypeptidase (penicillin-binding protein 5/6)